MTVIYFHGFASGPNGSKVDMLREAGFTVFAPEIDIDPDVAKIFMEVEPLSGKRHVAITERRTRKD